MKGSSVLKRLFLLCNLLVLPLVAEGLGDILSKNKSLMFEYDLKKNELESDKLSKSWINPIMLRYNRNYSTQFPGKTIKTGNYSVSIDQPIFRSGGIYYAIKYADTFRKRNKTQIELQKRQMIGDAVSILFQLKKNALQQKKYHYLIDNDKIDIHQKRDSYNAGLLDSSFLDQAILKKSQDEANLLALELSRLELAQRFALLSDKDPHTLKLPRLTLVSKEQYHRKNLELKKEVLTAQERDYQVDMTTAKYLPSVSVQGQYLDGDLNPLWASSGVKERYYNYGFSISMPLDVNSLGDIESSKVARLRAKTAVIDKQKTVDEEYRWIKNSLNILDRKIMLAKKDEKIYQDLYRLTQGLIKAGEKTPLDGKVMRNSWQIRKLDEKIYEIDKQLQLLKLYIRMDHAI